MKHSVKFIGLLYLLFEESIFSEHITPKLINAMEVNEYSVNFSDLENRNFIPTVKFSEITHWNFEFTENSLKLLKLYVSLLGSSR